MTALLTASIIAAILTAAFILDRLLARRHRRTVARNARRMKIEAQRRERDDQAYGDELAVARAMMRPSLVSLPRARFDSYLAATAERDPYSRKVPA